MKIATETDPRCAYMAKPGQRGSRRNVCTAGCAYMTRPVRAQINGKDWVCQYGRDGPRWVGQWQGLGVPIWQSQSRMEGGGQQMKRGWREEVKGVIPGVPIWQSRVNNEVRGN